MEAYILKSLMTSPTELEMTSLTVADSRENWKVPVVVILSLLLFVSMILNAAAVYTIVTMRTLQTSTNYYELSTFIFVTLILGGAGWVFPMGVIYSDWTEQNFPKMTQMFLKALNVFIVLHETTKIVERYFGLSRPLHSRAQSLKTRAIKLALFIWCFTVLMVLPIPLCDGKFARSNNSVLPLVANKSESGMRRNSGENAFNGSPDSIRQLYFPGYTRGAVCQTYSTLSPYGDFFFLYFIPLLLNAIFFGITVRQLRHVCEDESENPSWKLSKTTGLKYKTRKKKQFTRFSEFTSSGFAYIRDVSMTQISSCVAKGMDSVHHAKKANQFPQKSTDLQQKSKTCIKNQIYTIIFPSITFLTHHQASPETEIAPSIESPTPRFKKQPLKKRTSNESAVSCMTTFSNLSEDLNEPEPTVPKSKPQLTKKPSLQRGVSLDKDPQKKNVTPTRLWRNRIRAVKNLAFTMAMFCLKWLPYHAMKIYLDINSSSCLTNANCNREMMNPDFLMHLNLANGFLVFLVTISSPMLLCVCSSPFYKGFLRTLTCGRYNKPLRNLSDAKSSLRVIGTTCDNI